MTDNASSSDHAPSTGAEDATTSNPPSAEDVHPTAVQPDADPADTGGQSGADPAGTGAQPDVDQSGTEIDDPAAGQTGTEVAGRDSEGETPTEADVSSPAKVMRIGTMVKQLLEEVRGTELDEKGRERLAQIHRRSIDELEDGLSSDLIDELERLDLPFDSTDGPPSTSELRIAQAQLVGWLEGLFHGIQTAIMAQQAMTQQGQGGRGQLPPGMVAPGAAPGSPASSQDSQGDDDRRRTGNYL